MVHRIILLFLTLFSLSFAQDVKISSVGIKDLSQFMMKDFTYRGEIENLFILEDLDSLSFLYFKGFYREMSFEELKKLFKSIKDENLRSQLEFDLFKVFNNKYKNEDIKSLFDEIIVSEKMKLLLAVINNDPEIIFNNPSYNAFLKGYHSYNNGQINEAIKILEPYKHIFPNTFIFFLLSNNEIDRAKVIIKELDAIDKNLILYADYMNGECERILNDRDNIYDYGLELMKMDCSMSLKKDYEVPQLYKKLLPDLQDDDFTIIRLFLNKNILHHEKIYPFFETFYYRWKLLSYITFLESYLQDVEIFKGRIQELKKEFQILKENYFNYDNTLDSSQNEILKKRFVNLASMMDKLEMVDNIELLNLNVKEIYKNIYESYQEAKDNLKKEYLSFSKFLIEEEKKLLLEKEFRMLDKIIWENKNLQNIDSLIDRMHKLIIEGENKYVSYIEKAYYNKIFLMWNSYLAQKINDEKKRREKLNEIITLINKYFNKYKNFDRSIYLILAEANDHLGNFDEALRNYEIFLKFSDGKNIPTRVYIKVGDIYFDKKNYINARENYILAKETRDIYRVVAIYKIAWTYYLEENYESVLKTLLYEDIYTSKEVSSILLNEIIELIAKTFHKMNKGTEADKLLSKALIFPYPEKVFKSIGDLYVSLAEYDKAMEVYEKGLRLYYLNYYSPALLVSKIELLTFLGKDIESYKERLRFNELYKKGSLFYEKFNIIPQEYEEVVITAGYYFANKYEKYKDIDSFKLCTAILVDYLESLPENKRYGEVNFLLGQIHLENSDYELASVYYYKAYLSKFKEEESYYGYIKSMYLLWEKGLIKTDLIINEFERFIKIFDNSPKNTKISLALADLYIKNKNQKTALDIVDNLIDIKLKEDIQTICEFLSSKLEEIDDKVFLANLFEKCYKKSNFLKFKELKHFALFIHAQNLEKQKNLEGSKNTYLSILNDYPTKFREPSLYNLAILESQTGNNRKALEILKEVKEGEFKMKALEFMLSVGLESGYLDFAGEAAEKVGRIKNNKEMLFKAIELYIKSSKLNDANRLINLLSGYDLTDLERDRLSIFKGIYLYNLGDIYKSAEIFKSLLISRKIDSLSFDEIALLNEITKKIIFTLSEDEARIYLENFIDLCTNNYKKTGYIGYKYFLGSILLDYSIFFVNKEEAIRKGTEILKNALKESVEMEEQDMTLKLVRKIKDFSQDMKDKSFILPSILIEKEIMGVLQE